MNLESAWWHAYNQQSKNEAICWRMSHLPRQGCISEQQPPLPPLIMNTPPAAADGQSSSFRLWPLARPGALPSDRTGPAQGRSTAPENSETSPGGKGNPGLPVLLTDGWLHGVASDTGKLLPSACDTPSSEEPATSDHKHQGEACGGLVG